MADAILTALGKPESPMKAVFIGTLAPATSGWWHDLVNGGSKGSTFVMLRQGDRKRWDRWPVIQQANPLTRISPEFRRRLLAERDAAREDTRLKAQFLSYRLNLPTADESEVLLTVEDFDRTCARAVPAREGLPVWGFDLGGGRAWSAAVSIWPAGRCEALAVAPGIPSIDDQERRDRVPRGTYRDLVDAGTLRVAEGLRVPRPEDLVDAALNAWGEPAAAICDRFRAGDMADAAGGRFPVYPRVSRWSEAAADVRALRKIAADGPLAIADGSRGLIQASLAAARVKNDDQGSCRIAKAVHHARSRDDVAAALVLAAGVHVRSAAIPEPARPIHIPLD
ncbi:MAG: hypothetical protein F4Y14_03465 [Acidobacteria bacterium]|nr:hypothetical protein [Acidobacteriota bacterium]